MFEVNNKDTRATPFVAYVEKMRPRQATQNESFLKIRIFGRVLTFLNKSN